MIFFLLTHRVLKLYLQVKRAYHLCFIVLLTGSKIKAFEPHKARQPLCLLKGDVKLDPNRKCAKMLTMPR